MVVTLKPSIWCCAVVAQSTVRERNLPACCNNPNWQYFSFCLIRILERTGGNYRTYKIMVIWMVGSRDMEVGSCSFERCTLCQNVPSSAQIVNKFGLKMHVRVPTLISWLTQLKRLQSIISMGWLFRNRKRTLQQNIANWWSYHLGHTKINRENIHIHIDSFEVALLRIHPTEI